MALGTDKDQKHQLCTRACAFWALNGFAPIGLGVRSPHAASGTSPTQLLGCFSPGPRSVRLEGSCILSLMAKEAGAGSLDCLDTVVGEWSFTSDKILVSQEMCVPVLHRSLLCRAHASPSASISTWHPLKEK